MHEVLVDNVKNSGTDALLPLAAVRVPAGETWSVRIQGTITKASSGSLSRPSFRIGTTTSGKYAQGAAVDFSGTVTAANSAIAIVLNDYAGTSFFGTVTIDNAVQITLGADLEARDQLRAALTGRGLDHTTVKWIPFDIKLVGTGSARELFRGCAALMLAPDMDTSGVTSTRSMYYDCSSLIRVPGIDTSQVTDSRWMFYNCASLTSAPDLDTAKVTSMYSMYSGCASLTSVPDMGTGNVTDMSYMFSGCTSLTTAPAMGTSKVTDMGSMFNACSSLTSVPAMDTSKVTSMTFMFNGCSSLTSVPAMNTSNATTLRTMFQNCSSLTYIPDLQASNVGDVSYTFNGCSSLTDGNVRLIGKKAGVVADYTISRSGLTRLPFYDTAGNPI